MIYEDCIDIYGGLFGIIQRGICRFVGIYLCYIGMLSPLLIIKYET